MADISQLGNLQSTEPLDLPIYDSTRKAKPFPRKGYYTARTPESFPAESFGKSAAGFLTVDVSPTLVGGEYDGYKINFTKVSTKTWTNKDGKPESQFGRYLRATGHVGEVPTDPQALADLAETTANTLVNIGVDWIARSRPHGFELKGMENFPSDGNGGYLRRVPVTQNGEVVKDPITGEPLMATAFLEVFRWSPASN
jgi:hypothetical protein